MVASPAPTASNTITVSYVAPAGLSVTGAQNRVINSANTPLTYTINAFTGCTGLAAGVTAATLQFKALPTGATTALNDAVSTGNIAASLLVVAPTALTVTCSYDGTSHYVIGTAQTVTVTSPASRSL